MTDNYTTTILIVDDEAIIAMEEAATLKKHGFHTIVAHTGEEAIEMAAVQPGINLVLMDIDLGSGMDGTQAAEVILEHLDIPVLFLSSHTEPEMVEKTERITSYGYVVKNSGETVLLASIKMAFKLHSAYVVRKKHEAQLTQALSERKLAEESIRRSEEKYRTIFEKAATANSIVGEDSIFILVNSNFEKLTGYTREELEGKMSWAELVAEEDLERMKQYHIQRRTGPGIPPQTYEFRAKTKSGEIKHLFLSISMIPGTKESVSSIIDITEHKRMKEIIRQSEKRFSDLAQFLPETVFETDIQGRITFVNEPSLDRFGYTSDEFKRGLSFLDILVPEEHPRGIENFGKALRGELTGMVEYTARKKDGTRIPVMINTSVIVLNGRPAGLRGFLVDITRQKRDEEVYKMYRHTIDQSSEIVFWLTKDGGFEYVNEMACRSLGYTREELMKMSLWDIGPSLPREQWEADMARYYKERQGGSTVFETVHRRRDGSEYPVEVQAQFLWFGDRPMHVAVVRDISERRRTQQALRESEERWQFALEGAGDGVWDWDVQSNRVFFSRQWKAQLGYEDHEIGNDLGEWDSRIHPDDRDTTYRELNRHLEGAVAVYANEHRLRCKNGVYRWILDRGKVISRTPEGKPLRVIGTHTDITERKRNEERYSAIIQAALDGFIIFDMDGRILEVNAAYARMSGYSRDELTGMTIPDIDADLKPGEMPYRIKNLHRVKLTRFETRHRRKDGALIDVEVSIRVLEHESNRFFVFVRDITRQKNDAAALENSLHEKEALFRELQHRMKNSLAMIISLIGLEMDRLENSAARETLEGLRGRIDSLSHLYEFLSRSDMSTRVDLDEYIQSIASSLARTYIPDTSAIHTEIECEHMFANPKNATAWGLIANELVTNALKYAFPVEGAGTIRVRLQKNGDSMELSVSDNGAGPPEDFDLDKPKGFGTLLVKMLARQLRGTFSFARGEENVFTVRAPAPPDAQ
ncbi:MAG: PAS domain S-box protein [Spirochaetes bacterium]|nr:PAS domain S-box protein [Spirochaetota bacterium]